MTRNTSIKKEELTMETFIIYCKLFLTEKMFNEVPAVSPLNYGYLNMLINSIETVLFTSINTETGKLLLANKLYTIAKSLTGEEFSREFLYNLVCELSECIPVDEETESVLQIKELANEYANTKYDF